MFSSGTYYLLAAVLLLLAGLVALNRRRRPVLQQAHRRFDLLVRQASGPLDQGAALIDRGASILKQIASHPPTSETGRLVEAAHERLEDLQKLLGELDLALAELDAELQPSGSLAQAGNMLSSTRYQHVLDRIEKPQLTVPTAITSAAQVPPQPMTFDAYLALVQQCVVGLEKDLKQLEAAGQVDVHFAPIREQLDLLLAEPQPPWQPSGSDFGSSDLDLDDLFRHTLPTLKTRWQQVQRIAEKDPVGAARGELPGLRRQLEQARQLVEQVRRLRLEWLPALLLTRQFFQQQGLGAGWLDREIRELGSQADDLARQLLSQDIQPGVESLARDAESLQKRAETLMRLAEEWETALPRRISELEARIGDVRGQIAQTLKQPGSQVLQETGYRPEEARRSAERALKSARSLFQRGDQQAIEECWGRIQADLRQAENWLQASQQALAAFDGDWQQLQSRLAELQRELEPLEAQVHHCESQFRGDSLQLEVGEPPTPLSLRRCLEQLNTWWQRNEQLLNEYRRLFSKGDLLQAWNGVGLLVADLDAWWELAGEIRQHLTEVQQCQAANGEYLQRLQDAQRDLEQPLARLEDPALAEQSASLKRELAEVAATLQSAPGDPLRVARTLEQLEARQLRITQTVQAQDQQWRQIEQLLDVAEAGQRVTAALVRGSLQDRVADSAALVAAQQQAKRLEESLAALRPQVVPGAGDLLTLFAQLQDLASRFQQLQATLRQEIQEGRAVSQEVQQAERRLFEIARWQGDDGIVVVGGPGTQQLSAAQRAIAAGDYATARRAAADAVAAAERGLRAAQGQVSRFRIEELRRAKQARRRQQLFRILEGDFSDRD